MKIFIASDHAGYYLKEELKHYLAEMGYEIKDFGNDKPDEKDDYPDFIKPLAEELTSLAESSENTLGIVLGGSGQGEAICANRYPGIRAVVYYGSQEEIIKLSREHNNANVLSLGARFVETEEAKKAVALWLETMFDSSGENERHQRRINKIDK